MATYKRPKGIWDLLDNMDAADLTLSERQVLIEQYRHGDRDGRSTFPSEELMATNLSVTTKTVRDKRASLRAKGWLIKRQGGHQTRNGDGRASVYEVVIPLGLKPVEKVKRKANNAEGYNKYRKKPSSKVEEESSKKPSEVPEEFFHLPALPVKQGSAEPLHHETEEQLPPCTEGKAGQPDGGSGAPAAPGSGSDIAEGDQASGPHVAGTDRGSAPVSKANQKPDPWGPALPQPHHNYEPRHDLPEGIA